MHACVYLLSNSLHKGVKANQGPGQICATRDVPPGPDSCNTPWRGQGPAQGQPKCQLQGRSRGTGANQTHTGSRPGHLFLISSAEQNHSPGRRLATSGQCGVLDSNGWVTSHGTRDVPPEQSQVCISNSNLKSCSDIATTLRPHARAPQQKATAHPSSEAHRYQQTRRDTFHVGSNARVRCCRSPWHSQSHQPVKWSRLQSVIVILIITHEAHESWCSHLVCFCRLACSARAAHAIPAFRQALTAGRAKDRFTSQVRAKSVSKPNLLTRTHT